MRAYNFINLIGSKFTRLTVLKLLPYKNKDHRVMWKCLCSCGNILITTGKELRNGRTKSCGCYRKEMCINASTLHGLSKSAEHRIWRGMLQRCYNANRAAYKNYGGRGIKVCKRWRDSFESFYLDMGIRPNKVLSIDRINNNKGYSKENCRWATRQQQNSNRRKRIVNGTR